MLSSWLPYNIIHQFEGIPPRMYNERVRRDVWHGGPPGENPVIVLFNIRDFLNFSASWIKHLINANILADNVFKRSLGGIDIWYEIAMEAFGDTHIIKDPKHVLFYDQMVESEAERRFVCSQLGGVYNENYINKVPPGTPGSSFDKFSYQGSGSQMKVLERWKWFLSEEGNSFISCLHERREVVEYYSERCIMTEGQQELVNYILK